MPKKFSDALEYTSKSKPATESDVVNVARTSFAKLVEGAIEAAKAAGNPASDGLKAAFEETVRRAEKIAKDHGHVGDMRARAYQLLRTAKPHRGYPKDLIAVESLAKAVGAWSVGPEDMNDPYMSWEKIFGSAGHISVFAHADPRFWTADRLRAQVAARARMLVTGLPARIRRVVVLPDDRARTEWEGLANLRRCSTGVPPDDLLCDAHGQRDDVTRLLVHAKIETRCIRKGPLVELWNDYRKAPERSFCETPVSSLIWGNAGQEADRALIWELDERRKPRGTRSIKHRAHVGELASFFEEAFACASETGPDGAKPPAAGSRGPMRKPNAAADARAARESVP